MRVKSIVVTLVLVCLAGVVAPVGAEDGAAGEASVINSLLAKYDQGFRFTTRNGDYELRLNGLLQARYTYVDYDPEVLYNQQDYSNTYLRRARLYFSGHVGSPRFTYLFHVQLEPNQGLNANDLWLEYEFTDLLRLGVGRNKIAYGLEMLNSGSALGMVERSLMYGETDIDLGSTSAPGPRFPGGGTGRFGLSWYADNGFATGGLNLYRSQGIQLRGQRGSADRPTFEYQLGFWQGRGTNAAANLGNDHLVALRVGYHPWGFVDWRFVGDIDGCESFKAAVIGSIYRDSTDEPVAYDEGGYNLALLARWRGWSVDVEWGTETFDYEEFEYDFDRDGWRVSFGWFVVPGKWEVRTRYAEIQRLENPTYQKAIDSQLGVPQVWDGEDFTDALEAKISELSLAASVFIPRWRNRLIFDISRLARSFAADPDAVIDGVASPIRKAPDQVDHRVRAMVQLVF
jgi:hypothetical protein